MAAYIQDAIMLFGDSITQKSWDNGGFGAKLAYVYGRKLDVLNRGLSGFNTEWAIPVFEQYFARQHEQKHAPKTRILTIWFGANDACIEPSPQHVPLNKFVANLRLFVDMVHSPQSQWYSPETKIILIAPPPVNTYQRKAALESRNPPQKLDRLFDTTKQYAEAVVNLGSELKLPVVDVWTGIWKSAGEDEASLSKFLLDGLHLNAAGYEVMYKQLMDCIWENIPELHPDNLMYVFVPWDEINRDAPRSSLVRRDIQTGKPTSS